MPKGDIINKWMTEKGSDYRNKVARILRLWKKHQSLIRISKELNISEHNIRRALRSSKWYVKPKTSKEQLHIKNSAYRKRIANALREWRLTYSVTCTSKKLNIGRAMCSYLLLESKSYRNRYLLTRCEATYVKKWTRKKEAIKILGGQCVDCGNNDPFVIDFHHFNDDKEYSVARLFQGHSTWEAIMKEAQKCILLCRNCHALRHSSTEKFKRLERFINRGEV